jgi:Tfp pilus assembly protein PilF
MQLKLKVIILLVLICQLATSHEDLYDLALREYQAGRYKEAREIILKKTEKKAGDFNLLGWIELKLGNFQEAQEAFLQSLELKSDLADSYAGLGYVFFQRGDLLRALSFFEKGLALDQKNEACSEGKAIVERILKEKSKVDIAGQEKNYFFARGNYFWRQKNGDDPSPLFIKGVNIGFALPGKYPSEFPENEKLYEEWLALIAEMGANAVRVYTILPPAFYLALYRHNTVNPEGKRLFLIQGIWVELPEKAEFRNEHYLAEIKNEIKNAVDVIHGQARIEPRYGHAHGHYEADISNYVLAFIFGREWEPGEVIAFNQKNDEREFDGQYLALNEGTAFEVFLTEMLDYLIAYEDKSYKIQRPVALVNWPTLDPLYHPSEATLKEEVEIRKKLGEKISTYDFSQAWDEDAASVDETKIRVKPSFRAGLFVAYHVYPYYPDFMRNEEKYALPLRTEGSVYYGNYLRDLKAHYRNMPLLIAEFGLPTSRGIARFHPEGLNHGGLSEEEQAEGLKKLFLNIKESGCAGGLVFSWIDEWWKASWMTRKYEDNDPLWYNAEDPEENYGLLAMLPSRAEKKLRGDPEAWSEAQILYYPEDEILSSISVDSDEGYLYLKLDLKEELDWRKRAILLAIDTSGDEEGDHLLPFNLGLRSPVGFEFVALLHGKNSQLLVDDSYSKYIFKPELARLPGLTGFLELGREEIGPRYNLNGIFQEIITIHRRRFSREGKIFGEKIYKASPLIEGRDFCYSKEKAFLELRLPWALLNFLDPSRKKIIYFNENKRTEGVRLLALSYQPQSEADSLAREKPAEANIQKTMELMMTRYYRWPEWNQPSYQMKLKKSYYALKELFQQTENPALKINLPVNFNFDFLISLAYKSKDEFLKYYSPEKLNLQSADFQDYYGYALACLTRGVISGQAFYLLEAKNILAFLASSSREPREREISSLGVKYIENLLEGNFTPME